MKYQTNISNLTNQEFSGAFYATILAEVKTLAKEG